MCTTCTSHDCIESQVRDEFLISGRHIISPTCDGQHHRRLFLFAVRYDIPGSPS